MSLANPRTMRQARANLSGDDGDFSISSMSDNNSSHRANKSTLNKTSSGGGGCNPLGKIFGKNYFVDGEQLLRHISPSQPRSPRIGTGIGDAFSSSVPGTTTTEAAGINLLNVTELNKMDAPSHLRLTQ